MFGAGRAAAARGVTAASFLRQEGGKGKKPKRHEKLKRRSKAEGEQNAPEESEPGDGGLRPPSAKKAKKSAEENGAAELNGSAPASGHGGAPAAAEPGCDAEVTAVRGAGGPLRCPAAPGSTRLLSPLLRSSAAPCLPAFGFPAQMRQTRGFSGVAV